MVCNHKVWCAQWVFILGLIFNFKRNHWLTWVWNMRPLLLKENHFLYHKLGELSSTWRNLSQQQHLICHRAIILSLFVTRVRKIVPPFFHGEIWLQTATNGRRLCSWLFQSIVMEILGNLNFIPVYIDDILIIQRKLETEEDHLKGKSSLCYFTCRRNDSVLTFRNLSSCKK